MTAVEPTSSIDAIVARAEEFMRSGHIKATRCGPPPKCEGIRRERGKGRAFEWLCEHVGYDEKKCLFWPFSKNYGYPGLVSRCGKSYQSARLMCLLANGAPPSEKHRASHTCVRGNKGCIHPRHLVWKTVSEASRDAVCNGQWKSGYGRGGKLTPAEAAEIRALHDTKGTPEIAKMYGLSPHWIAEILRGNGHVKPRSFSPRDGRFYPRLAVAGRVYSLGGFPSAESASAAYEAARMRARRGEPVLLSGKEKPIASDIRRFYIHRRS